VQGALGYISFRTPAIHSPMRNLSDKLDHSIGQTQAKEAIDRFIDLVARLIAQEHLRRIRTDDDETTIPRNGQ